MPSAGSTAKSYRPCLTAVLSLKGTDASPRKGSPLRVLYVSICRHIACGCAYFRCMGCPNADAAPVVYHSRRSLHAQRQGVRPGQQFLPVQPELGVGAGCATARQQAALCQSLQVPQLQCARRHGACTLPATSSFWAWACPPACLDAGSPPSAIRTSELQGWKKVRSCNSIPFAHWAYLALTLERARGKELILYPP